MTNMQAIDNKDLENFAYAAWEANDWHNYDAFCDELIKRGRPDPRN